MAQTLSTENIWYDKWRCDDAEAHYQAQLSGCVGQKKNSQTDSSLVKEIAKAREHIKKSLTTETGPVDNAFISRIEALELENKNLCKVTQDLTTIVKKLETRIAALEAGASTKQPEKPVSKAEEKGGDAEEDDDDDCDLFASDDEDDAEAERVKQERIKAYAEKKSKKPTLIAKSNIILDVKPWDDETDMAELEKCVRSIEMDGLLWGVSRLMPVGYGIKKMQITCVVEDDKVGTDDLEEKITAFEDYIQSMDIAAFNKI